MGIRSYGRRMLALASLVGTLEAHADDGLGLDDYVRRVRQSHPAARAAQALDASASA